MTAHNAISAPASAIPALKRDRVVAATESILCVDDDFHILEALKRQFRNKFALETALGSGAGLKMVADKGPFAVVISDFRMPGLDGLQFLSAVHAQSPKSVLIMLTGEASLSDAINALNQGVIFRFLRKPIAGLMLAKAIEDGIAQYRLLTAERDLTQHTLLGVVEILVNRLAYAGQKSYKRALRVRALVARIAAAMGIDDSSPFEIAAMLSPLGLIELGGFQDCNDPDIDESTASLIGRIPRMSEIASMIEHQRSAYSGGERTTTPALGSTVVLGAHLLRIAQDLDSLLERNPRLSVALTSMRSRLGTYDAKILNAIETAMTDDSVSD